MLNPGNDAKPRRCSPGWSNRILFAAIAGILFLTLYPFRFSIHAHAPVNSWPFLLGRETKRFSALNVSLNVLLFIPFGFGLSSKLRQRNCSWTVSIVLATLAGAVLSYAIEFVQIYVPPRDSGWDDIFSNTTGSVLGAVVFAGIGRFVLRELSEGEENLESWLSAGRAWLLMLAYLAACVVVSIPLQRKTSLKNWEPNSYLFVGNDGSLESPWKGQVFRLQIWDHAIPDHLAQEITSRGLVNALDPSPLADYDFSRPAPIQDQQRFLPDLSRTSGVPPAKGTGYAAPDGNSWLVSQSMVNGLTSALQKTNQFTVRVVCRPPQVAGAEGAIASIAQPAGKENLTFWQKGSNLAFWFRNRITTNTWNLRWSLSEVFSAAQVCDILISYDGSNLSFFVNGRKDSCSSKLGPGLGLAQLFHRTRPSEVQIYNDIYYLVVFFPVGCLLGIGARKLAMQKLLGPLLVGFFIAPVSLQIILLHTGGRLYSFSDLVLSPLLAIGAALWVNTDRVLGRN
jgi:VanZ like protein